MARFDGQLDAAGQAALAIEEWDRLIGEGACGTPADRAEALALLLSGTGDPRAASGRLGGAFAPAPIAPGLTRRKDR